METQNPYKPSVMNLGESQAFNPVILGLRLGFLFASPFLLFVLLIIFLCILRQTWNDMWLVALPLPLGLAILFSGAWWGFSIPKKFGILTFVLIGLTQGLLQSLIFFSSTSFFAQFLRGIPKDLPNGINVLDFLFTAVAYSVWALLLGYTVKWRVNKRLLPHSAQNA